MTYFPEEIWVLILSYYHAGNMNNVCLLFNRIITDNRLLFLSNSRNIEHAAGYCRHYYKTQVNNSCIDEIIDRLIDRPYCYCDAEVNLTFGEYIIINTICFKDKQYVDHYYSDPRVISLKIPGGRCIWICTQFFIDTGNSIIGVINKTSWENDKFIAFCTNLMSSLLPKHAEFFKNSLKSPTEPSRFNPYWTNRIPLFSE